MSLTSTPQKPKKVKKPNKTHKGGLGTMNTRAGKPNITRSKKQTELQKIGMKQQTGMGKNLGTENIASVVNERKNNYTSSENSKLAEPSKLVHKSFAWLRY